MAIVRFQLRRDTKADWTAANPTLRSGEPGLESDTGWFKIGDGMRPWSALPYYIDEDAVAVLIEAASSGSHTHDDRYLTEAEVTEAFVTVAASVSSVAADVTALETAMPTVFLWNPDTESDEPIQGARFFLGGPDRTSLDGDVWISEVA